jgi:single-strand selective monofunctional uracil DNA glycosylase
MKHPSPDQARRLCEALSAAAQQLSAMCRSCSFGAPVAFVYNPLEYAWKSHLAYLQKYGSCQKKVLFLGMNPGPFGMAQTGIPFGEITAVRDWLHISAEVAKPAGEHPKRPVEGFACRRSEVSGRRLWGLFAARFGTADNFFSRHFVVNYCPLAFFDEAGRNLTPDKLRAREAEAVFHACDQHLRRLVEVLEPEWLVGIGDFAGKRGQRLFANGPLKIGRILHPSPASPAANRDWAGKATAQLKTLGIW